ncbi:MAG TPA: tetratricopeptide repeat protein [Candidatus Nitrosopolaris sp.]|nr:tetratricopeptide repeat protein [Candidatus Nitrosopolaris sp.]
MRLYTKVRDCILSNAAKNTNKVLVFKKLGILDGPVKCYDRTSELDPKLTVPYINKAVTLSDIGRNEEALPVIEKAIGKEPMNLDAIHAKEVGRRVKML